MTHINLSLTPEEIRQLMAGEEKGFKVLLEQTLNELLDQQRTEQLAAGYYERSENRKGSRNGFKERKLNTRIGTITLSVPQIRDGQFSTELFERYQRSEQALVISLMEMVVQGVSTRKIKKITEELCGVQFSASTISNLCKKLDPIVDAWKNRDLSDKAFPFLLVDAMVIKIRHDQRVRPYSVLIVTGINEAGSREILGMHIGVSESESSWSELFESLKDRGLHGVHLIVSDDHRGLVKAVQRHFQGVMWQRCQTHFTRNILDKCPKKHQPNLKPKLRTVFEASDIETARKLAQEVINEFGSIAEKAVETLENGLEDSIAVLNLPEYYRKRLRTTNSVERLNEEIRRRERVIRIFPNQDSAIRLIGALLVEHHEDWSEGRRYFDMDAFREAILPPEGS